MASVCGMSNFGQDTKRDGHELSFCEEEKSVFSLCVCDIFQFADLDVYCAVCVRLIYRPILGSEDKLLA